MYFKKTLEKSLKLMMLIFMFPRASFLLYIKNLQLFFLWINQCAKFDLKTIFHKKIN